jgi:hypothetical protein
MSVDFDTPWLAIMQGINLFLPLILMAILLAIAVGKLVVTASSAENGAPSFRHQVAFVFSFSIVGAMIGIIINLIGGFSIGSSGGGQSDPFQFVATLAAAFSAIVGLFLGETRVQSFSSVRPIGTASAILMMMFGYFYISQVFALSQIGG